jgi:rhodanese-related sulfurtransferase
MRRFLARIAILCGIAALVAVLTNAARPDRLPWLPKPGQSALTSPELLQLAAIHPRQVLDLIQAGNVIIIDARPQEQFHEACIPGAVNVPGAMLPQGAERLFQILPPPDGMDNTTIVIYCQGADCIDSLHVFDYLSAIGYRQWLRVLTDGFPAWHAAGMPIQEQP